MCSISKNNLCEKSSKINFLLQTEDSQQGTRSKEYPRTINQHSCRGTRRESFLEAKKDKKHNKVMDLRAKSIKPSLNQ